jgi:hypothetical protein
MKCEVVKFFHVKFEEDLLNCLCNTWESPFMALHKLMEEDRNSAAPVSSHCFYILTRPYSYCSYQRDERDGKLVTKWCSFSPHKHLSLLQWLSLFTYSSITLPYLCLSDCEGLTSLQPSPYFNWMQMRQWIIYYDLINIDMNRYLHRRMVLAVPERCSIRFHMPFIIPFYYFIL